MSCPLSLVIGFSFTKSWEGRFFELRCLFIIHDITMAISHTQLDRLLLQCLLNIRNIILFCPCNESIEDGLKEAETFRKKYYVKLCKS